MPSPFSFELRLLATALLWLLAVWATQPERRAALSARVQALVGADESGVSLTSAQSTRSSATEMSELSEDVSQHGAGRDAVPLHGGATEAV